MGTDALTGRMDGDLSFQIHYGTMGTSSCQISEMEAKGVSNPLRYDGNLDGSTMIFRTRPSFKSTTVRWELILTSLELADHLGFKSTTVRWELILWPPLTFPVLRFKSTTVRWERRSAT